MPLLIDVTMEYDLGDDPMVFLTIEAAATKGQKVLSSNLEIENATLTRIEGEGGLGQRLWARVAGPKLRLRYHARVQVSRKAKALPDLPPTPLHDLPGEAMSYLRPSRFCQSDMFPAFVARQFEGLDGGARVAAIRDWVETEMSYVPGTSNAHTTVLDTFASREGVCRDYAHMVCALCRAGNIPARYAAVYGIGVTPPDFHAVAQVWLAGAWHLVDATGMCQPEDLAVIAVGRDACDIAFMETGAAANLVTQEVSVTRKKTVKSA